MKIELFSDFACPFCYIAKKRLSRAIQELGLQQEVQIEYKAYQLDADAPTEGVILSIDSMREYMSAEKIADMQKMITEMAAEEGLVYDFDNMKSGNTETLHRLSKWAATQQKEHDFIEAIMDAYFTKGLNPNSAEEVLAVVAQLGLSTEQAAHVMQTDAYAEELRKDAYDVQQVPVTSVPFFVFENRYGIVGAEPLEVFTKTLKQAQALSTPLEIKSSGNSCGINGCDI